MQQRNGIEGTISELVRGHGLRRARYRGFAKVDLQNQLLAAACNVKRWLHKLQQSESPDREKNDFIVPNASITLPIGATMLVLRRLLSRLTILDFLTPNLS